MEHLTLFGNPILEEYEDISAGKKVPFVVTYDDEEGVLKKSNKKSYEDKIKVTEVPDMKVFNHYVRYWRSMAYIKLKEVFDITPKLK